MPEEAKKILSTVHPDFSFKLVDGGELTNLEGLFQALKEMEDETFYHHVTTNRNDFANWVKDVLKDEGLAEEMSYSHDKVLMEKIVSNRILELHEKIQKHQDLESFEKLMPTKDEDYVKADAQDIKDKDVHKEVTKTLGVNLTKEAHSKIYMLSWGILIGLAIGIFLGYLIR